ncbi:MAG TPA: hypothetical protein VN759_06395 [Pseudolysinimonas sp.]|nr:hypothetical protein [Pseudolysinimonas sp.]
MQALQRLFATLSPLVLCATAAAQGRIVVAHDDWTLTNSGFASAPATGKFVRNVADWFTGGQPGTFRAWSNNAAFTGSQLAQALTGDGHTWTVSTAGTFDLATLQQYDGLFVGGYATGIDAGVLTQYVQAGGNVYVCAGVGGASFAASLFNPFLASFGLAYATVYDTNGGLDPTLSPHPLFAGVPALYAALGNSISLTATPPAGAQVLVSENGKGLFAAYDGGPIPTLYCTAKVNSQGCLPAIAFAGSPSASGAPAFAIGASGVINKTIGLLLYGYQAAANPFQGGTLCIGGAVKRTPGQGSGGSPTGVDCTGTFSFDFNAYIAAGVDPLLAVGQQVNAQYWSRDVASSFGASLTDALEFVIGS